MNSLLHLNFMVDAYADPLEYIQDELVILDVILEYEIERMSLFHEEEATMADSFRGMYVSASEVKALLEDNEPFVQLTGEQELLLQQLELRVAARVKKSSDEQMRLPIHSLRTYFQLSDLDIRLLMIAIAPHVNRKYVKLFAYIQDDMSCQYVTLDLMLRLGCRSNEERKYAYERMTSAQSVMKSFFTTYSNRAQRKPSLLTEPISLETRMISFLLGLEWRFDGALASLTYFPITDYHKLPPLLINEDIHHQMLHYMTLPDWQNKPLIWALQGPSGCGKTFHARHLCGAVNRSLLEFDISNAPDEFGAFTQTIDHMLLEAKLHNAIPAFDCIHKLPYSKDVAPGQDRRLQWLFERIREWTGMVFLFSEEAIPPALPMPTTTWIHIHIQMPDLEQSEKLWQQLSNTWWELSKEDSSLLAGKFTFTLGQMIATVDEARKLEAWNHSAKHAEEGTLSPSSLLHKSAYHLIQHQLQDKAVKVESKFSWDDLILPNETIQLLRQACNRLKHRHTVMNKWGFDRVLPYGRGISMMFTGPPGTGKTMSALVMAKEMESELYRVDLSRVVSKYVGETEKNLSEIFDQAKVSGAILFFDEADALFGKRSEVKDAHDKYANMETSYLLQKMEEYDGLTILATNFAQNMDDAFTRRIQFIIKYPFPDAEQREQLWRSSIPEQLPIEEIDYSFLSQTFELSGGPIKNIILTAAYLAVNEGTSVTMKHMVESAIQEYKKTGKLLLKERLGPYAKYWRG